MLYEVITHGNILRSPFAAAVYRRELARLGREAEEVNSAGFVPLAGRPADPRGSRLAAAHGVSLDDHASRVVTAELVDRAELVVVMDRENEARRNNFV